MGFLKSFTVLFNVTKCDKLSLRRSVKFRTEKTLLPHMPNFSRSFLPTHIPRSHLCCRVTEEIREQGKEERGQEAANSGDRVVRRVGNKGTRLVNASTP